MKKLFICSIAVLCLNAFADDDVDMNYFMKVDDQESSSNAYNNSSGVYNSLSKTVRDNAPPLQSDYDKKIERNQENGNKIEYTNAISETIGYSERNGNKTEYQTATGKTTGYAQRAGNKTEFTTAAGKTIGYGERNGNTTTYTDASGRTLGSRRLRD